MAQRRCIHRNSKFSGLRAGVGKAALSLVLALSIALGALAADPTDIARRLAERARTARDASEVVRAYMLYDEAARLNPAEASYAASRDALTAAATLLEKTQLVGPIVAADIASVQKQAAVDEAAAHGVSPSRRALEPSLESFPHVQANDLRRDFDIRGTEISLIEQVCKAYGVRAAWDPQLDVKGNLQMRIAQADFRTAMDALTMATNTFVFPVSPTTLYFVRDNEAKRNEFEPVILLTIPLPDATGEKDLIDVANAVRGLLNLRAFGWDAIARTIFVRDHVTRALAARSMLEALLLPRAEVELEVQVLNGR